MNRIAGVATPPSSPAPMIRDEVKSYWAQMPAGATWMLETVDVGGSDREPWVLGRSTLSDANKPTVSITPTSAAARP